MTYIAPQETELSPMASAYELVAQTRPRVRQDTLYTRTPDGVLFHNAQGGFRVDAKAAYRVASLLMPHLNGANRVADICENLSTQQREMVGGMVRALYERGFARDVPPGADKADLPVEVAEHFATQIAYIDHYVDAPASRFGRFREARVAVLGAGPIARWCVLSLVRNGCGHIGVTYGIASAENRYDEVLAEIAELSEAGCPVRTDTLGAGLLGWSDLRGYEVVVVAGGRAAAAQLLRLVSSGVPTDKALIPAWTLGPRVIVGPLSADGTTCCWVCAALRLGANDDGDAAATLWRAASLPGPAPASGEPIGAVAAMLGNLLGYEVFRLTTGALAPETQGSVVIQDLESLDVVTETLLPHPGCPYCAPLDAADATARLRALEAEQLRDLVPDGTVDLGAPPAVTEAAADALVSELSDRMVLFGRHAGVFIEYSDERWTQLPLKVSTVRLSPADGSPREIAAFDLHHVAAARRRALHAAASVYAECGRAVRPSGSDGLPTVRPGSLSSASGIGDAPTDRLVEATSLLNRERCLVPSAAVFPFGPENVAGHFLRTRAGTGAGASLVEAVQRGLLSALCLPALLRVTRGGEPARIALDTVGASPELDFLTKSARNLGLELELLDLGTHAAHVLLARAQDPDGDAALWSLAAHPRFTHAAAAAVRDLLGRVQLGRQLGGAVDDGDPVLADLDARTLIAGTERPAPLGAAGTFGEVLADLRQAGQDALVVPTTPADLRAGGIETVRVLVACR